MHLHEKSILIIIITKPRSHLIMIRLQFFYNNFASFCIPTLLCASMHTHVGINGVYPTWVCANCKPFHIHTHTTYTYIITGVLAYLPVYIQLNSIRLNCIHVKVCTQVSHSNNSRGKTKYKTNQTRVVHYE